MPILVPCPHCSTMLSAPDNAAGKCIRCPKLGCGTLAEVPTFLPAEEVPVVDATVAPPKPRPKRVEVLEDDEDDRPAPKRRRRRDDEFDHSRRRRRKSSGTGAGTIIAIVLGGLAVLGGIGYGVYALVSMNDTAGGSNSGANRAKAPVPAGWVQHTATSSKFKAYFPKHPLATTTNSNGLSVDMVMTGGPRERLAVIVFGLPLPPQAAGVNRDQIAEIMRQGILQKQGKARVVSQRSVTWAGRTALEMTLESGNKKALVTMRQLVTDTCIYIAFFACETGRSPEEENGFFDNFELIE